MCSRPDLSCGQCNGEAATRDPVAITMRYHMPRFLTRAPRLTAQAALVATVVLASPVGATWKPEYANQPFEVQQWYRNAELTKAAQTRFPFKKCCDHSDVVKTKFNVNKTSSGDEWYWLDGDSWRRIPDDIIHWQEHAPNGQPTLFIYNGKETCFFPGDSGF